MESLSVKRRMDMIAAHFAGNDELTATHLLPLNCSSVNSVIRRCDNRMLFARQGSTSQACYMRQVTIKENLDEYKSIQNGAPPHSGFTNKESSCNISGAPLFSRSSQIKPDPRAVNYRPAKQECQLSMEEPPIFSRPYRGLYGPEKNVAEKIQYNGRGPSAQMDVIESGSYYVMTVKLPDVSINNIRVEVDEQNLIVTGKHSTQWGRTSSDCQNSVPTYQKRETFGPYQIVWPLPSNVNKDLVSAEFLNGVLRITLPKV